LNACGCTSLIMDSYLPRYGGEGRAHHVTHGACAHSGMGGYDDTRPDGHQRLHNRAKGNPGHSCTTSHYTRSASHAVLPTAAHPSRHRDTSTGDTSGAYTPHSLNSSHRACIDPHTSHSRDHKLDLNTPPHTDTDVSTGVGSNNAALACVSSLVTWRRAFEPLDQAFSLQPGAGLKPVYAETVPSCVTAGM
jgi:hypothetical protein